MRSTVIFAGTAQIESNQHSEDSVLFSIERSWGWLSKKMSAPPSNWNFGFQVTKCEHKSFRTRYELNCLNENHATRPGYCFGPGLVMVVFCYSAHRTYITLFRWVRSCFLSERRNLGLDRGDLFKTGFCRLGLIGRGTQKQT